MGTSEFANSIAKNLNLHKTVKIRLGKGRAAYRRTGLGALNTRSKNRQGKAAMSFLKGVGGDYQRHRIPCLIPPRGQRLWI